MVASTSSSLAALPTGRFKVDVVKTVTAPRDNGRMAKTLALVTKEHARFEVNAEGVAEERQPWEQRLAMSDPRNFAREEQAEAQKPAELLFEKTGEAVIDIVPTADGHVLLQADASLPELSGIILDVAHDSVETPFGRTSATAEVASNADRFARDAWSGTQWQLDAPDELPGSGTSIRFAIGRLADNRVVVNYEAKQVANGVPRRANCTIVFSAR